MQYLLHMQFTLFLLSFLHLEWSLTLLDWADRRRNQISRWAGNYICNKYCICNPQYICTKECICNPEYICKKHYICTKNCIIYRPTRHVVYAYPKSLRGGLEFPWNEAEITHWLAIWLTWSQIWLNQWGGISVSQNRVEGIGGSRHDLKCFFIEREIHSPDRT